MNKTNISKILIANRGEIACRVIRTTKKLGIASVAVYSDADKNALHVKMADEAVYIGASPATESYLIGQKILDAAKLTGANAIHPGYGFLSENPEFAELCEDNNIIFVGPSAKSMRAMALKGAAKALMVEANVPVVPGYHGDDQSLEALQSAAGSMGYPVLIKAVAGGGGKGMRVVRSSEEFPSALSAAQREGKNSFGNAKVLIEKLIEKPRHIEVQVFGDSHGNAVHLFERDCSLQRRHQKVVEEAPAPGLDEEMRLAMGEAAVRAAKAINYQGAGTIEFIVDVSNGIKDAPFYFMEMNTRLQVEHPVTEMITDTDLVEWQINVASGLKLPLAQQDISINGHSIEVRLYAEDPSNGFLPATGRLTTFDVPTGDNTRVETGVTSGDEVSIYYDPMIAKMVVWGRNRKQAIASLKNILSKSAITGLTHNRDFLYACLDHKEFMDGDIDTGFISRNEKDLIPERKINTVDRVLATLAILQARNERNKSLSIASPLPGDPWDNSSAFSLNLPNQEVLLFREEDNQDISFYVEYTPNGLIIHAGDSKFNCGIINSNSGWLTCVIDGLRSTFFAEVLPEEVNLVLTNGTVTVKRHALRLDSDDEVTGSGVIISPMPGKILKLFTKVGETIKQGDPLLIMEAMKMEQTILATCDGVIEKLTLTEGEQVTADQTLLVIHSDH